MKALIILSGGADSTICLAVAKASGNYKEIHAITFNYGQKHATEIDSARKVAAIIGVNSHEVIDLPAGVLQGSSPLTNRAEVLEQYADANSLPGGLEKTFVPVRNAMFMTIALNRAYVLECEHIYTGVCQEDFGGYPDCRQMYVDSLQLSLNLALGCDSPETRPSWLKNKFEFITPLMDLSKGDSVLLAENLSESGAVNAYGALAFTTTAYDGKYPPVGKDHATLLRAKGFEEVGMPDPIWLRAYLEGLVGKLPETDNYKLCRKMSAKYEGWVIDAGMALEQSLAYVRVDD